MQLFKNVMTFMIVCTLLRGVIKLIHPDWNFDSATMFMVLAASGLADGLFPWPKRDSK